MFTYYGGKGAIAGKYPEPLFNTVIEPFAGGAKYALLHWQKDIVLYDKYEPIIKVWHWLQNASISDVLSLPRLKEGERLSTFNLDEGARLYMGFVIAKGGQSPRDKASSRATTLRPYYINKTIEETAANLFKIRHWKICLGSYKDAALDHLATWFIDPPYQVGGHVYPESNKHIDYTQLAIWCKSVNGQVIVCENDKADWLPFKPLCIQQGSFRTQKEVIYTSNNYNL